jgi:hypothetical protein
VVGDIHGEIDALNELLERLGYDPAGRHPDGRRLVFTGDLCDRGPDSPAVIERVRALVESGRAQCIAGNHEINLLRRERKHGNHWFFGETEHEEFGPCVAITAPEQDAMLAFLKTLPIALERADLRVVHAAWIDAAIEKCRPVHLPVDEAYADFDRRMRASEDFRVLEAAWGVEKALLGDAVKNAPTAPPATIAGRFDECHQMSNPIRVVTSGVERANEVPFHAGGKWRYVDRVPWWLEYNGSIPVLFGHYWRWWDPRAHVAFSRGEPQLFADDPIGPFMADHHTAFCIDFSVGARYKFREQNHAPPYHGRLAAMRWPERELVYDGDDPVGAPRKDLAY